MSGLPEGMANGSGRSEHLGKDAHIWERPWTLEEIRQSSASWSLAADSGLFLYLQDFSQRMLSKTHEIEKQLDSLIRDTKATDSCLHSVFNDFLMLSNTQFIENRVYDEEVEDAIPKVEMLEKQPEQEKTREQKEAELIPKMQEAVNYGLRVLDSAFEHLDIKAGNSDSEDEEVTDRVEAILEPKDLYVDRPLPYLIGSQAFMEQEDVGLGDLSSDEMSVDSDRDSVIESDDGKEEVHSDEDFDPDEERSHNAIKKKSSMMSYEDDEEEEDEDSDIFGESDKDDDEDAKNTGPSSFADELAARIKGEPVNRPEGDRASLASKKKSKGRKDSKPAKPQAAAAAADDDSDNMFKPPKMDDDVFSPFGGKGGLFSGGRGLFDDDDEGDLFSEAPKPAVPEERKALNESLKSAESDKPGKKIPAGAISIFPDNSLFSSGNDSDSVETKKNGALAAAKQAPAGGGGLFDDEEEDDDFFSSKSSKKPESAAQEKPKPKKAIDLFADEDEDGDIFSEKFSASTPTQSKREAVEEPAPRPEKKMPAGAISMFGPGTKSLLSEGLKKRQPSTSDESDKSEENGPAADIGKLPVKQTPKPQTRGLFSDDEDAEGFPTIPRSQSKPEPTSQGKSSKAPLSLFDDEEDEDLFASAAKSKPKASQASTLQTSKALSSSLFSDDEDQWMSPKSTAAKSEAKPGGMKASASAPSSLPSAKMPPKSSLFDDEDEDDLFAPSKESSQKKPQRVALLFEDEGDDDDTEKGSLFGIKPAAAPAAKTPAGAAQPNPLSEKSEEAAGGATAAQEKPSEPSEPQKPAAKAAEPGPTPQSSEGKKKPAGAVSLFGGIDVLASKQTKSPLDEDSSEDGLLSVDGPPPAVPEEEEEEEVKTNAVSLFDDEEEEDESDWNDPIFTPSKPTAGSTAKPAEERPQATSTGVFQDEELLFSRTQQRDNDPDVDLFATSGRAASSKASAVKPAAQSLFADDDEDDLFGSVKPKAPPKVAEKPSRANDCAPLASPESVSDIQASLKINPAALLPGAAPSLFGAESGLPATSSSSGVSSSSLSPSPATTPVGAQAEREDGVSFDTPVQVTTLQSAHKSRAKVSGQRRPQSRAARQQAAQRSVEDTEETPGGGVDGPSRAQPAVESSQARASPTLPNSLPVPAASAAPSQASLPETPRPLALSLPASADPGQKDSVQTRGSSKAPLGSDDDDLFGSDGLFGSAAKTPSARQPAKSTPPQASSSAAARKDKEKSTLPSIFDDNTDDLFQKVKPRPAAKKAQASSFLEDDGDDDEDIFGGSNSSAPAPVCSKESKTSASVSKQDIFQDEVATVPKAHKKHKEKTIDASLFDDNIDIFADLTDTLKPKQKSKTKGETKSIFDDDMDDIFSPSTVKPVTKAPVKSKKTPLPQETSTAADSSSIFDDPLNALGGN